MNMKKKYLTVEGKKNLQEELNELKTVKRPRIVKEIERTREFGDLSENAEYHAAREEQSKIESRISEIEDTLLYAIIIDTSSLDTSKVSIGTRVSLYDEEFDEEVEYKIVGTDESDPAKGYISNESPVGAALIGCKVGETVVVDAPGGQSSYKILDITL